MHLDDTADAFGLAREGIQHAVTLLDTARVNPGEGEGTVTVVHDLERQRTQRFVRIDNRDAAGFVAFEIDLRLRLDLGRVRQILNHSIKNVLYALCF